MQPREGATPPFTPGGCESTGTLVTPGSQLVRGEEGLPFQGRADPACGPRLMTWRPPPSPSELLIIAELLCRQTRLVSSQPLNSALSWDHSLCHTPTWALSTGLHLVSSPFIKDRNEVARGWASAQVYMTFRTEPGGPLRLGDRGFSRTGAEHPPAPGAGGQAQPPGAEVQDNYNPAPRGTRGRYLQSSPGQARPVSPRCRPAPPDPGSQWVPRRPGQRGLCPRGLQCGADVLGM